jgi:hypothetical protein
MTMKRKKKKKGLKSAQEKKKTLIKGPKRAVSGKTIIQKRLTAIQLAEVVAVSGFSR